MGEAKFGLIDGVLSTVSGWVGKDEVVRLTFDPKIVSYRELVAAAKERDCATLAFPIDSAQEGDAKKVYGERTKRSTPDKVRVVADTKYYLRRSVLRYVPMTTLQATRVNAKVASATEGTLLSPRQKEALRIIEASPDAGWTDVVDKDLRRSWEKVDARIRSLEASKKE